MVSNSGKSANTDIITDTPMGHVSTKLVDVVGRHFFSGLNVTTIDKPPLFERFFKLGIVHAVGW